jgi:acyl-CoA dehydrogenase
MNGSPHPMFTGAQMQFGLSERAELYRRRVSEFMNERIYPAELLYRTQMKDSGNPNFHPPVLEELKAEARKRGLWNLFHPHENEEWGSPGLSNIEYAPLCELMGRSPELAPEAMNCNAPDTGNMEILELFGTAEQKERWLKPLLAGEISSAFSMTEPEVASSDATNVQLRMRADGDSYVLSGRKWFTSNAMHPLCELLIVMGKTDPDAPKHRQQSMMLVPVSTAGVTIVRSLPVFGYMDRDGHAEIIFEDVRVPKRALLAQEGDGFAISQARLGPGRIHHCMRAIGKAERALDLMITRAQQRVTFGQPVASRSNIQDWIADSRIEIEMIRLLTLKTAWLMDTAGNKQARTEIAAIKVAAPAIALKVIDRAIQVHGAAGFTEDFPLASFYAHERTNRVADGPDEVHRRTIAQAEMRRIDPSWSAK